MYLYFSEGLGCFSRRFRFLWQASGLHVGSEGPLLAHSLISSFEQPPTPSCTRSFTHSFIHSSTIHYSSHSPFHPLTHSFAHPATFIFTPAFHHAQSLACSLSSQVLRSTSANVKCVAIALRYPPLLMCAIKQLCPTSYKIQFSSGNIHVYIRMHIMTL